MRFQPAAKIAFSIVVTLMVTLPTRAQSNQYPRLLPKGGGTEGSRWIFEDGPDFYVFRSQNQDASEIAGYYAGNHASFRPDELSRKTNATFLGNEATWHLKAEDDKYKADLLITVDDAAHGPSTKIHAWVIAGSTERRDHLIQRMSRLKLVPQGE